MPLSERDYMRARPTIGGYRRYRNYLRDLDPVWVIIILNLLVFIASIIFPGIVLLFGLRTAGFLSHPWTILTSMFTHYEMWHIISNMLTFYFFGRFLIALVGQPRFLLVYLVGGIVGNIFYMLLASPFSIAIGASGAIYALGGALVVLRPQQKVLLYFFVPIPLWVAVIGGFLILWQGVAWQAHLGGLVFGLVAGYWFKKRGRLYL